MDVITGLCGVPIKEIGLASVGKRRLYFETATTALYAKLFPDKTLESLDHTRFGDLSYLRLYGLLKKL